MLNNVYNAASRFENDLMDLSLQKSETHGVGFHVKLDPYCCIRSP
jgi:hypothetical protein